MPRNDDLGPWGDHPVVRALSAPGSPEELAGESQALDMFRSAGPRRLQLLRRIGTGGTALTVALLASGGVAAAAYTNALPQPVQQAFHVVLGGVGVPAPGSATHRHRVVAAGTASASGGSGATPLGAVTTGSPVAAAPSASAHSAVRHALASQHPSPAAPHSPASRPPVHPVPTESATAAPTTAPASPSGTPAPTETSGTPTPSPTDSTPQTATVVAMVDYGRVPYDGNVQLSGQLLDSSGQPVAHHRAAVYERQPGGAWALLAYVDSDDNGDVWATVGPVTSSIGLMLRSDAGHSDPIHVVMVPTLSGSVTSGGGSADDVVTATTQGAQPGEVISVLRRVDGAWRVVGHATVDGEGHASYSVPAPAHRSVALRLVLPATAQHGAAQTKVVLPQSSS